MTPGAAGSWSAAALNETPLAHRGLWGPEVPENSLAAFAAARDAGVGVELDVRLAADGVPVVFHDRQLERLTTATGRVDRHTSAQLASLRLGGGAEGVPTLAEALDVVGDRPVMVEVKSEAARPGRLETAVAPLVAGRDAPTCVASFNPTVLRWFRRQHPAVPRVLTAAARHLQGAGRGSAHRGAVRLVDPVALSVDLAALELPAVQHRRDRGTAVVAWTVRSRADLAIARAGADGVIFEGLAPAVVRGA